MNKLMLKTTALLGATLISTSVSYAHEQNDKLGNRAGAVDYYRVSCFDDGNGAPDYLLVSVKDNPPVLNPILSVQVQKDNVVKNSTDLIDGDAKGSPEISMSKGNSKDNEYSILVNKTRVGAETYTLDYHCMTAGNEHTGTSITYPPLQNQ